MKRKNISIDSEIKAKKDTKVVFLIPHFHYDSEWLKTREEYLEITLDNVVTALELCETNPEYRFCFCQVAYLEPFIERIPELRKKLKELIQKSRIEIVCGMYTQPQPDIPSGEFLIRNFFVGKSWVRENLGFEVVTGWLIDTYGLSPQLPQILKKSGFKYLSFWRGVPKDMPGVFLWRGIDGSKIIVHWIKDGYAGPYPIPANFPEASEKLELWLNSLKSQFVEGKLALLIGEDFAHPQKVLPKIVEEWNKIKKVPKILIATPSNFFQNYETKKGKLQVFDGEFGPIHQGIGAARTWVKQRLRGLENLYLQAEKLAVLASLFGKDYPMKQLERNLKRILLNQFHDITLAECIDKIYRDVSCRFQEIEKNLKRLLSESAIFLGSKINTSGDGLPLVVFNSLSWSRTDIVSAKIYFTDKGIKSVVLKDSRGEIKPLQIIKKEFYEDGNLKMTEVVFTAEEVPPLGYATYYLQTAQENKEVKSEINLDWRGGYSDPCILENQWFKIELDGESKALRSIYDKKNERELLDTSEYLGNVLVLQPDFGSATRIQGDYGGQYITEFKDALPKLDIEKTTMNFKGNICGKESGPIRAKVAIESRLRNSPVYQEIIVYSKIRRIDFLTKIYFKGPENHRIKVVMPTTIKRGQIWNEIPYGVIERKEGLYLAQNWVDYSEKAYGITLSNKGIPSNTIDDGKMALTLLRSFSYIYHHYGEEDLKVEDALEVGREHTFEYSLYPHQGDWREAKSYRVALEFNNPLKMIKLPGQVSQGSLPEKWNFLDVEPKNLIVSACKKRKDGQVVLRIYETEGSKVKARIKFSISIKEAYLTNLLEEKEKVLQVKGKEIAIHLDSFEIVTLRIKFNELNS